MVNSMNKNNLKSISSFIAVAIAASMPRGAMGASFSDYLSGCFIGLSGSAAGGAVASSMNPKGSLGAAGYATTAAFGCIAGVAFTGIISSSTKSRAEYQLSIENGAYRFENDRLMRENSWRDGSSPRKSPTLIREKDVQVKELNGKVIQMKTYELEATP